MFEKLPQAGGQLRVGIPDYRLPREVLDDEIAHIASVGVEIVCGAAVSSVDELVAQGYAAVLVAVGTHRGVKLPLPGADLEGVLLNTEFLRKANLGEPVAVGERVVVLGGGPVAFDCAGVAKRLGAKEVTLACLEPREAMKATEEDVCEALEYGACLFNSYTFDEILGKNGKVTGVACRTVTSCTFGEDGVPDICVKDDSETVIPADTVIFAIGQRPDLDAGFGVELGRGGRVIVQDEGSTLTGTPGVFATGDAVTGTVSVVTAIAGGRRAAAGDRRVPGRRRSDRRSACAAAGEDRLARARRGLGGPGALLRRRGGGGPLPAVRSAPRYHAPEILGRVCGGHGQVGRGERR